MEMYSEEYDYGYLEELLGLRGESSGVGLNQELCISGCDDQWINAYSNYPINHDYSPPLPIDCSLLSEYIYNSQLGIGDPLEFHPQDSINYSLFGNESDCNLVETRKFDTFQLAEVPTTFNIGSTDSTATTTVAATTAIRHTNKGLKKLNGQPSKNLMAERRRRKRLNDRLSMLRSVVPKISKMDRTSILGDTIDYMKELLERINNLQEAIDVGSNQLTIFKDVKPNEILVRNSPKFDVERRNGGDTRIDVSCAGKPGLLLSTLTTLEALGFHIQHCVISCFNEFAMQASCLEKEHRGILSSEDVKQALFRNAGYGGRCL